MGLVNNFVPDTSDFARPFHVVFVLFFLFFLRFLVSVYRQPEIKKLKVPVVGRESGIWFSIWRARLEYIQKGPEIIQEAYQKHKETIFQIPTVNQNLLILPTKYIDELKSLPETVMSSSQAVADYFLGSYTTLRFDMFGHIIWDISRGELTQNLGNLVDTIADETNYGFSQELPSCEDWTPIQVHARFLEIVGRTSARVFVGYPLCRDALWLSTSIDFARCIFLGSGLLKVVPSLVRPFAALLTPYIWRIHWHHRNARKLLIPEILRRRAIAKTAPEKWVTERPNDMLQWLEEASVGDDARPESIVHRQLGMSFAAIHTTTNHLTNVIYDLATRWDEYGMELRMEVITSLNEDGGTWKKTTLTKLSKLDSFMKESQRLNPPSALSFNRKLLTPHTLSSDPSITLPASTYIAVAAGPIGLAIQPSPATFDGLRFHRLRTAPGASPHAHQFVTTGPSSMTFGHGKFACPGRFFASNESKMILATLLLKYELKLVGTERPKNLVFADANFPDPNVKVLFRRRQVEVAS